MSNTSLTELDFERVQGDTYDLGPFIYKEDGAVVDISSGYVFSLRVENSAGTAQFTLAGTIDDGPAGKFKFVFASDEFDLDADTYTYEVQMTVASKEITIMQGSITLTERYHDYL